MVEADDTSDLPYSVFVLPEVNELRLADRLGMVETVNADLHRATMISESVVLPLNRANDWSNLNRCDTRER